MISDESTKRPFLLTCLCIVSGITGTAWICMFIALIIYTVKGAVPEQLFPGNSLIYLKAGTGFVLAEILLTVCSLTGVFLIWKTRMGGFYLYSISKVILYFLPVAFIGSDHLAFFPLAVTSVTIVAYGILTGSFKKKD
jgi:hypothetical protein